MVTVRADAAADRGEALLAFDGVRAATGDPDRPSELTLAVRQGEIVGLLSAEPLDAGPLGSESAGVLRLALGLERPASGRVALFGTDLAGASRAQQAPLRARVGVVWRGGALFDDEDVAGNVGFPLRQLRRRPAVEVARAVRESLLLVGLEHIEHLRADELADGVRCRVALARAVVHRPALLLLDDPSAGLDPLAADAVAQLVAQLRDRLGLGVLVVTRDARWVLPIADRVAILRGGHVVAAGCAADVRANADPAVQQLLAGRAVGPLVP